MIDIKSISGITRFSTAFYPGAKGAFSLMKEDYIILPFNTTSPVDFQVGDYVDLRGILDASMGGKLAKIYQIVDMSYPTYKNGGYSYELRFDAYYWQWKTKIFKYTPEVGGQEASWSLTASLDAQVGVFLRNLKALGYKYEGKDFTFSIDKTVENKSLPMSYDNINLLDAIFEMANQWNCDCWVTDHVINFGRCEFSDPVKIELDVEAQDMSRSESKGTFATRIYAFGSSRNIPTSYRPVDTSMVVGGIVERRLMLPVGTPYVDAYEGMTDQEAIEAVVVFDDVYPHRVGTISNVTSYESEVDNEDGTKTKATFYRFKDSGINFSKEYILEGNELKMRFQSGKLNGMEFGAMFNPLGLTEKNDDGTWNPDAQLWEIVLNEDYGRPLPDDVLCPEAGNTYVLTGWNSEKITELGLVTAAEQELLTEAKKYIAKTCIDDGTYTATLKSTWVYEDQINRSFDIGQKINLINPAYFKNGRTSRVIGFEIKLDLPYDSPEYTIGESAAYSRISDIETKVEELTFKGQTYTGSGGSNIYVIKTNDSTAASNFNVFSALRTLAMFLRKDIEDEAKELITFLKGLHIGKNGSGFTSLPDGTSQAVVDRLYVKIKAVFDELEVKKKTHVGGEQVISPAGMKCIKVEEVAANNEFLYDSTSEQLFDSNNEKLLIPIFDGKSVYRCYFKAEEDGIKIENQFTVGQLAMSQECNIKTGISQHAGNRFYWRTVTAVGVDYIELSKTDCFTPSDIPAVGDDIIGFGHKTDITRQGAIVMSSTNEVAPAIIMYQGINGFTYAGKEVISLDFDKVTGKARMKVYGSAYIGAKDRSSYMEYIDGVGIQIKLSSGKSIEQEIDASKDAAISDAASKYITKTEHSSSITQLSDKIELKVAKTDFNALGDRVSNAETTITQHAGQIALKASQSDVTALGTRINSAEAKITPDAIKLTVKSQTDNIVSDAVKQRPTIEDIKSQFTISTGGISMMGKTISLAGMVTFGSLDSAAQATINGKATNAQVSIAKNEAISAAATDATTKANNAISSAATTAQGKVDALKNTLKSLAYLDTVEVAKLGTTVIDGGYIKTTLIKASSIHGNKILAETITANEIQSNTITAKQIDVESISTAILVANAIKSIHIAAEQITAGKIAARSIEADRIKSEVITANEIKAGTITARQLDVNDVRAKVVTADYISALKIVSTAMIADAIKASSLNINDKLIIYKDGSVDMQGVLHSIGPNTEVIISDGYLRILYNGADVMRLAVNQNTGMPELNMKSGNKTLFASPDQLVFGFGSGNSFLSLRPEDIGAGSIRKNSDGTLVVTNSAVTVITVGISCSPQEGGTTSPSPSPLLMRNQGETEYVEALPNAGYQFDRWSDGGAKRHLVTWDKSGKSITAYFTKTQVQQYTVTLKASPTGGGSVSGGGIADTGTVRAVSATPGSGYRFVEWSDKGSATHNVTWDGNKTLTAYFELYSVTGNEIFVGTDLLNKTYSETYKIGSSGSLSLAVSGGRMSAMYYSSDLDAGTWAQNPGWIFFNKGYLGGKLSKGHKYRLQFTARTAADTAKAYAIAIIGSLDASDNIIDITNSENVIYGEEVTGTDKVFTLDLTPQRDSTASDSLCLCFLPVNAGALVYISNISLEEI